MRVYGKETFFSVLNDLLENLQRSGKSKGKERERERERERECIVKKRKCA